MSVVVGLFILGQPLNLSGSWSVDVGIAESLLGTGPDEECDDAADCEPDSDLCFYYGTECETGHQQEQPSARPHFVCVMSPEQECDADAGTMEQCLYQLSCKFEDGECVAEAGTTVWLASAVYDCNTIVP